MSQGPQQTGIPESGDADSSRGDPELIGRVVSGKYKIEKLLGGGAMGAVYKARFAALEKNVAVKVMHRSIAVDPSFVGRFHREAKAASRLDHPNSMRVIDFGEEPDGLLYIAMEYVEGRDLYRVIHDDWPISNADIADLMMQALAAIAVAHEMGVIHRDLKPENLMILRQKNDEEREAYHVKVCDFGIAKITEKDDEPKPEGSGPSDRKLTTQGLVVGTPEYMSPEQAKGEKLDARSDIYSMGVILYQLLTGRTPFNADTPLAVVLKHITENPQPPVEIYPGVHRGLEAVAMRALTKDRNGRWQTSRAMRNAIREALEGRPMPVDAGAETAVGMSSPGMMPLGGTGPIGTPSASGPLVIAQGISQGGGSGGLSSPSLPNHALSSAPTIAEQISPSRMTPLGTASAAMPPKKSRAGLVIGLGALGLLIAGGAIAAPKLLPRLAHGGGNGTITPVPSGPASTPVTTTTGTVAVTPTGTTNANPTPPVTPVDTRNGKHNTTAPSARGTANTASNTASTKAAVETAPPPVTVVAPPTPPPPDPTPPPATVPPAPVPPPVTPPPAPVFNPATCRASVGGARASGATNSKDLSMNGTAGAWTSCAQSGIREKPGGPVAASVHLNFSDSGSFRGATCAGCPGAVAACIASSTGRTVNLKIRGGDVTGEPGFDVPVTFTCE